MACVADRDRDAAVREVAQVYELIELQQPLLLLHSPTTHQLAQSLLGKALRALNVALSVIKQQQQEVPVTPISVVKSEPHQLSPPSPAPSADSRATRTAATRGSKRRRSSVATEGKKTPSSSCATSTLTTAAPYDDGYEWRKYGEKKINGTLFTRSYFRCTYKDDGAGCLATKHVQQMDNGGSDPPMFHVTYNNHHTCNDTSGKANTGSSSNLAALLAGMKQEPTGHAAAAAMNMKQEPPLLLPALVDLQRSACFAYEQIPRCQQEPLFHNSPVDGGIPSATGSCISGETSWWDGYSGDMAAAEDDPLHDLERFLFVDD